MDFSSDKDLEHPLYVCGTGRRKRSTAWVTIFKDVKSAKMTISTNRRKPELIDINNYDRFNHAYYISIIKSPLVELGLEKTYGVHVIVRGGGTRGQIDAIKLAIARALCKLPFNRVSLKSAGYLQCDDRRKERKKYGLRKARKAPQYSKR